MMSSDDPVTIWIEELRRSDQEAAQHLWNHFVSRLYELSRHKLGTDSRRVYDEEDAALSAFHSVCAGLGEGRFPDLRDRNSLWQLLVVITARKVTHRQRYDRQQRRDIRRTASESIFLRTQDSTFMGVDAVQSREPTAEFAAQFVETFENLYDGLDDPVLRQVVTMRMEGHTDSDIADALKCSRRTVQRRVEVIRRHWDKMGAAE